MEDTRRDHHPGNGRPGGTLLVGTSHHGTPAEARDPSFTRDLVDAVIAGKPRQPAYFAKTAAIFSGRAAAETDVPAFWRDVAFLNYLLAVLSRSGLSPTPRQFEASRGPFRASLAAIRPKKVVFLAKNLGEAVIAGHPEMEAAEPLRFPWGYWPRYRLPYEGGFAWATWIKHPSRACRQEWHEVVAAFLCEAETREP